ncbi:uncharacterized protein [Cherax quadricarinatus]|uniref:uncharacterized protein n=1 Tax=Cherax quadricarinatus TaxID=27406 RepID=UPI002379D5A7|nr:uncharacterized protein LOC128695746 [Cherax quadricarinatus]
MHLGVYVGVAMLVVVLAGGVSGSVTMVTDQPLLRVKRTNFCDYWCRTDEGRVYCCGHVGKCLPQRRTCPAFIDPELKTCTDDYFCEHGEKCCFDRCSGEHICRPGLY